MLLKSSINCCFCFIAESCTLQFLKTNHGFYRLESIRILTNVQTALDVAYCSYQKK